MDAIDDRQTGVEVGGMEPIALEVRQEQDRQETLIIGLLIDRRLGLPGHDVAHDDLVDVESTVGNFHAGLFDGRRRLGGWRAAH